MMIDFHPRAGVMLATLNLLLASALIIHAGDLANRVRTIRIPGGSKVLKAELGSDQVIHLLVDSEDGPRYIKFENNGASFSDAIAIVDAAAQKPGLTFHAADLAVGQDGRVHVAMATDAWKLKLPQDEWSLHYASLAPGAKAFAPVRNLNRKPSEGFSLAADERGHVTACFLSDKLFTMVSQDHGQTFSAFAEINPDFNPCNCCTTATAYGADGKLAVLYREETDNERDMFLVLSDQGRGAKASRTRVSRTPWRLTGCPMTYYTVKRAPGGYVAAWPTKGEVYFARLDKDGAVLPPGEIKTPGTSGMRMSLLALSAPDGVTLVGWKNQDVLGWQLYDGKGKAQGEPGSAKSPGNGAAGVVLADGRFLLFP